MNIPHNEQKHNTNQTPLQYVEDIAYHNGNTPTNNDSVNSLTTHNNHYTLLYPDLVQELFNFSLHNNNNVKNNSLFFGVLGVNNTKYSSLDSSLSSSLDSLLSPRDILFFLQIVSLYQLELSKGHSSITYPSLKLAKLLGVDASCDTTHLTANTHNSVNSLTDANMRATVLKMTAKLESLGLLKVFRRKRSNGMDKANKLVPVLSDKLYERIKDLPVNCKVSDSSKLDHESTLEHILRTKLFVPIELEFMKSLFKNNLPSKYKLFFLNCIMSAYRNFRHNSSIFNSKAEEDINSSFYDSRGNFIDLTNKLSFSTTSRELVKKNNISLSTLKRIFRYIKQQGDSFFLQVEHKYTKSDDIDSNRYDKSIFVISINPLVFPIASTNLDKLKRLHEEELESGDIHDEHGRNGRISHDEFQDTNSPIFPDTYKGFKTEGSKKQPSRVKKTALNNKDIIIKNKDIDYIDANCENSSISCSSSTLTSEKNYKEEFLEDKQSLSSSEFYNNSSFFDKEVPEKEAEQKHQQEKRTEREKPYSTSDKAGGLELRHFYPISEEYSNMLNFKANREFDTNFTNQLLLKLYMKYPEKRFKNKFSFSDYMIKTLKNENHQAPQVNNPSFRFSCNIGKEEKNLLEYERYLNQIENSLDTSKEMCVKKKIAGRFSSEVAYKILTRVEFKKNYDNSFILALVPNHLDLSERQTEILSDQLEAVYGINGYYVQELELEKENLPPNTTTLDTGSHDTVLDIPSDTSVVNTTNGSTAWQEIRKGLIKELGEVIDEVWFSKAEAKNAQKPTH
ncbi:hypothetical protein [Rickettsia tamurae]|uniref:Uncharacterized protein n=1 Tax=Rickettsia tamurae subsp. buchneri TaxID=1462938 RepID=A0A8E0WKB3_9RICK|nr:hypothetical protein [Rickettsia tamurae]KDO02110.1 hypothetical protein REISMN_08635 [Rickettsia tamurae subsp. buchneri]